MSAVKIFWDPQGFELNSLADKDYLRATDGDTPFISVSIRMLSIDTPEVHYPGTTKPSRQDGNFQQLAGWLQAGQAPVGDGLAAYLMPRLATGTAGTLHEQQGVAAAAHFDALLEEKLRKNPDGSPRPRARKLFVWTSNEQFDQYGRLLAYIAPKYTAEELAGMSRRDRSTFNLMMVEDGHAASFIIYPSLPRQSDLTLMYEAAKTAFENRLGAWANDLSLTGYEFRMCVRLHEITKKLVGGQKLSSAERGAWVERFCFDMTTRQIVYPGDYYKIPVYSRIFIWPKDVTEAVGRLNLEPGA